MRCKARGEFCTSLLSDLASLLQDIRTHPSIQVTILRVVAAWLQGQEEIDRTIIPDSILQLVDAQTHIGWYQFFLGKMYKGWGEYQERYYHNIGRRDKADTGKTWASKVAKFMFEKQYQVWTDRNKDVHGKDEETRMHKRTEVIRELAREYDRRRLELRPSDRDLIPTDTETFLRTTGPKSLRQWALTTGPLIQQAYRRAKGISATGTESIKAYFGYGSSGVSRRKTSGQRAGTLPKAGHASLPSKQER